MYDGIEQDIIIDGKVDMIFDALNDLRQLIRMDQLTPINIQALQYQIKKIDQMLDDI